MGDSDHFHRPRTARLDVGDGDRRRGGGNRAQDLAVLLKRDEVGTRSAGGDVREGDGAPVGKGNKRATLLVILDNPLSVQLAESGR